MKETETMDRDCSRLRGKLKKLETILKRVESCRISRIRTRALLCVNLLRRRTHYRVEIGELGKLRASEPSSAP